MLYLDTEGRTARMHNNIPMMSRSSAHLECHDVVKTRRLLVSSNDVVGCCMMDRCSLRRCEFLAELLSGEEGSAARLGRAG